MPHMEKNMTGQAGAQNRAAQQQAQSGCGCPASLWQASSGERSHLQSEDDCLSIIDSLFPSRSEHTPLGRGDDCAELAGLPSTLAVSTDYFWQDVHFRTEYFTPEEAGAKALTVAVSDLAAAGAVPLGFSLAIMLPECLDKVAVQGIFAGMAHKARAYDLVLTGGDISRGERLGFSITVWGKPVTPDSNFLRRGEAKPGDCIFLAGQCGLAKVGLWALEKQGRAALDIWPSACAAHLAPRALLAEGRALALLAHAQKEQRHRLSLMDVSDGLMRDLPRLLAGLGANLTFDADGIAEEVVAAAKELAIRPEDLFLMGGEDYALLGSCAERLWPMVQQSVPGVRLLGHVTAQAGIARHGLPLLLKGFDHFSSHNASPADTSHGATSSSGASVVEAKQPDAGRSTETGRCRVENTFASGDRRVIQHAPQNPSMDAARDIIAVCREAWKCGLLAGFNGNVSCRVSLQPGTPPDACIITRSGAAKSQLGETDFALLSLADGAHLAGPTASTEAGMHLAVYRACPDSKAIMHTHSPYLLALSLRLPPDQRLQLPLPEAQTYRKRLAFTPSFPPGSEALANAVAEAARTHDAIWMEHHGLVVHGKDLQTLLALTEELEQLAKVHLATLGPLA